MQGGESSQSAKGFKKMQKEIMHSGPFKGTPIREVPVGYLAFLYKSGKSVPSLAQDVALLQLFENTTGHGGRPPHNWHPSIATQLANLIHQYGGMTNRIPGTSGEMLEFPVKDSVDPQQQQQQIQQQYAPDQVHAAWHDGPGAAASFDAYGSWYTGGNPGSPEYTIFFLCQIIMT